MGRKLNVNKRDQFITEVEKILQEHEPAQCPVKHLFTPGLYVREFHAKAGTLLTSQIHKTEHPFVVSKGKVRVYDGDEVTDIEAPYMGVTKPNTRRLIYVFEDVIWTTFHVTDKTDVDEIGDEILVKGQHDHVSEDYTQKIRELCDFSNKSSNKKLKGDE